MIWVLRGAVALFFFGMGGLALVRPQRIVEIFGGRADTASSRNEVRAVYGGFGISVGGIVASLHVWPPMYARTAGLVLAAAVLGMAVGRVIGAIIERETRFWPTSAFVLVELALAACLIGGA